MDYNARLERAHLVHEFLESENSRLMGWLAKSPNLNPVKHVWDVVEMTLGTKLAFYFLEPLSV